MRKTNILFLLLMFVGAITSNLAAQNIIVAERGSTETVTVVGVDSSVQWQLSTDNQAWYDIPNATNSSYDYKVVAPAYLRAMLTDAANQTSYSNVSHIQFEEKAYRKVIKSSGGQAYAENNGQPASGVSIQEDRGSDGKLKLTAISQNWTNKNTSINWYLYHNISNYDVDIILNIPNNVTQQFEFSVYDINNVGVEESSSIISVRGTGKNETYKILNVNVKKTGFLKYELKALTQPNSAMKIVGMQFNSITNPNGDVHATNYLSSPSVHLGSWRTTDSSVKAGQKYDWCYMEILVPEGGDPLATYYMSLGVLDGYMGIQTNSNSERGVIFSMWDDGDTDKDPTLDQNRRAGAVDAAPETTVSRFGNEGTGTKSFVHGWNWDTGVPVKFLTNARLEEYDDTLKNRQGGDSIIHRRNTLVSAWFHSSSDKGWQYISTLRLPNKVKYFDSWYSFLENYGYQNGQIKRYAYYYNAFAHEQSYDAEKPGRWINFNRVNFSNTDGASGQRVDFEQGVSPNEEYPDYFYMASGGYANSAKKYASQLPLITDKSVVESLDLDKFLERVDEAVNKEKAHNDSIKEVMNNLADKKNWTIESFSSEETTGEPGVNGRAKTIIDGDPSTYWHSKWQGSGSSFPHNIAVNMNKEENVTGFLFKLSGGTSRHMKGIELWGSTNGGPYELMLAVDAPDQEDFYIPLPETWTISKFKLVIKNSYTGVVHCRINEIDVTVSNVSTGVASILSNNGNVTLSVFPNPAKEVLNVSVDKALASGSLSILSLDGKTVFSQALGRVESFSVMSVELAETLHEGFYLLQINDGNKAVGTTKIYIQK